MYFIDAWLYSIASVVAATVAAATARAHGLEERCGLGVARGRDQICNAVLLAELRGLLSGRDALGQEARETATAALAAATMGATAGLQRVGKRLERISIACARSNEPCV